MIIPLALYFSDTCEREIVRNAKISKGSANKILRRLAELSLLQRQKKGRMVFYRLNTGDPSVRQLKIMRNVWNLREFVDQTKDRAQMIILFGSCAEGTDVRGSDIDVLILTGEKKFARDNVSRFNEKNDREISPIIFDAIEFATLNREDEPLYDRIGRGIILWQYEPFDP